jgi:hypothetical protein
MSLFDRLVTKENSETLEALQIEDYTLKVEEI